MHSNHCQAGPPHHLKLPSSLEGWCYKWNITFHFISRGNVMLQTNQNLTSQPLTFFISIWLPLSCRISTSLLFSSNGGWRLFKDKCFSVHDPCSNHPPASREQSKNMSATAWWLHECTRAHAKLCHCHCHVDCLALMWLYICLVNLLGSIRQTGFSGRFNIIMRESKEHNCGKFFERRHRFYIALIPVVSMGNWFTGGRLKTRAVRGIMCS